MPDTPSHAIVPGSVVVERNGVKETLYEPLAHQARFHSSKARFCLMEGGRGSGKSKAMRWEAYQRCLATPRFRALIVRRSMPELKQSHLEIVPFEIDKLGLPREAWHATDFVIRFPNGSTLRFGHCEDDTTLAKYLSSEFEIIYFDELATFTLRQFMFLCSSLRSPIPGYVPIARAGTNPVGPGATWVKAFFIDKNPSAKEAPDYDPADYESIHSTLDDNHHIDRNAYDKILNQLPSDALRKALRHGEWTIEGQMFSEWAASKDGKHWHVIDRLPMYRGLPIIYAPHIEIVRVLDWGYAEMGNPGVCLWFACLPDGSAICFKEFYFRQLLPSQVAEEIIARSQNLKVRYTVGDTAMWEEHDGPSIAESIENAGVPMQEADRKRINGWVEVHNWLRTELPDNSKFDGSMKPRLRFLDGPADGDFGCPTVIRTLPQQVVDPKHPDDIISVGVEDDGADDVRYFVMSRPAASREPRANAETDWIRTEIARRKRGAGRLGTEATRRAA
jgi:phage terminase large subunit